MLRLLSIELYKIRHHRASKFLIIAYFVILASLALISSIKFRVAGQQFHLAENGIFNFPYIWHLNTYLAGTLKIFLMLIIVSMMSNEYGFNTIKQNLIDGLSKQEFVLSKLYTVVLFALLSTLYVGVMTLILGLKYSSYTELSVVFMDVEYLLAYFVKLVAFFSFGLFLGMLIKRSAMAIAGLFVWFVVELIVTGMLRYRFKWSFYEDITQFLPLTAMGNLIKEPITRFNAVKQVANKLGQDLSTDFSVHTTDVVISLAWTIIFVYLTYVLLKKRDL